MLTAIALAIVASPPAAHAEATTPVPSQPKTQPPSQPAIQPGAPDITPPMPADAMRAYAFVDTSLRSWTIPEAAANDSIPVGACCVTLRARGKVLGRGEAVGGSSCIALATREAMIQAQGGIAALRDELAFTSMAEAAGMVTIGVEFAGALIPVEFQTYGEMDGALSPGLDGVAIRIGDKIEATFPSVILQRTIAPSLASAAAAARLSGDPTLGLPEAPDAQPVKVRETRQAAYYRFRVTHLAQVSYDVPPVFLHRAGKVYELSRLEMTEIRSWADGLAMNLVGRRITGSSPLGMSGTDWPMLGKTDPPLAGASEQALAILALCDYLSVRRGVGRFEHAPGADTSIFGSVAQVLALQLEDVGPAESPPWADAVSAASTSLAIHAIQRVVKPTAYTRKAEYLAKLDAAVFGSYAADIGWSPDVPEAARGLVAWAMLVRAQGDPAKRELADKAIAAIYLALKPGQLASQMPWLGFAELERSAGGPIAASPAYRHMRSGLSLSVYRRDGDDRDMAGGFVFGTSAFAYPTWHTARPAAFLAPMITDTRFTDPGETSRHYALVMENLRFLRQLMVDEYVAASCVDPKHAMWGVRSALWDQRQPVEATAITLIAVCESLRALDWFAYSPVAPAAREEPK